jgi:adenylate cyclase
MKKRISFEFIIPVVVSISFTLLAFFGIFDIPEKRLYDQLLHIKPKIEEESSILLIDVDDVSIARVGTWPWSRNIMADGLILLREFGNEYVVFDIEYTESSPLGVNVDYLRDEMPAVFDEEFERLAANTNDLFTAFREGMIPLEEGGAYISQLVQMAQGTKETLLSDVGEIARDNDRYLGNAVRFHGNAYLTVNMLPEDSGEGKAEYDEWVANNISYAGFPFANNEAPGSFERAAAIRPAIEPILKPAAGAGFPNIVVDGDGVRRRVDLFIAGDAGYYPQLALSALLEKLGNPEVSADARRVILHDAEIPGGGVGDIRIPRAEDGKVLINWPPKSFEDSFRHLSYYYMVLHDRQERALIDGLESMEEAQYTTYYEGDQGFLDAYRRTRRIRGEIMEDPDGAYDPAYRDEREYAFAQAGSFLTGDTEDTVLNIIDQILASEEFSADEKNYYREIRSDTVASFENLRTLYDDFMKTREILADALEGSFAIIGATATSTTDRGVNPFEKDYENVGTHASLVNMILQDRYLDELPVLWSIAAAFLLAGAVYLLTRRMDALPSVLIGSGIVAALAVAVILIFVFTGIYVHMLPPLLSVFVTFLGLSIIKFVRTAKERSYIRNAFAHYLSADVINDLLTDPDKLNLGGEKKYLTALFTDVRGFSTISEQLDPTDLVRVLNMYLTEMSDIILELRGTIDKYEGDAIISFFGAPVKFDDHPRRACLAAVRMKRAEQTLNDQLTGSGMSPTPLYTRIGINTGEMVVGNMGTLQKMDYTIMGNSVNLAARLEGVNKQYGTWLLISEQTREEAGDEFTYRRLDRVRVVGISEPVRLYELVEEESRLPDDLARVLEVFDRGLEAFEAKQWTDAKGLFDRALEIVPEDGPSKTFADRCKTYLESPPPENWTGIFNLSTK